MIFPIILFILFMICFYFYSRSNSFFISIAESKKLIAKSPYVNRMNKLDLVARKIRSKEEFKELYMDSIEIFSLPEQWELKNLIKFIDEHLLQNYKITEIPWKFSKKSFEIDRGWPTTHGDTIYLSSHFFEKENSMERIRTLIHEKIHIYQRIYFKEVEELFVKYWKFKASRPVIDYPTFRNNDDIGDRVYSYGGYDVVNLYKNDSPKNIGDSHSRLIKDGQEHPCKNSELDNILKPLKIPCEHPNELMAWLIPLIITQPTLSRTKFVRKTKKWMKKYF